MSGGFALFGGAEPDGATPLEPQEVRGLIPAHIAYRHELNEAEQENITRGQHWALHFAMNRRRDLLTEKFILDLHKKMLGDVWRWAGKFRTSQRNIGIDYWLIPVELRKLVDDIKAWIEFAAYTPDEIAVRFHHRLVLMHPFPNGNGRHARLTADLLVMQQGRERFSWGRKSLLKPSETRRAYIDALRAADRLEIAPLLAFSRA